MAINRKGMRKIVVDGETYHYKIKLFESWYDDYTLCVVIEYPTGKVKVHNINRSSIYEPFTPVNVRQLIKEA